MHGLIGAVFQTVNMATKEDRRIFIGGLVKGVTEEELMEKFSRFGQVGQMEIKTRTNDLGMVLVLLLLLLVLLLVLTKSFMELKSNIVIINVNQCDLFVH